MNQAPTNAAQLPGSALVNLLGELAPEFVGATGEKLKQLIKQTVTQLGQTGVADRVYIGLLDSHHKTIEIISRWETKRLVKQPPTRDLFEIHQVPWIFEQLLQHKTIALETFKQLPPAAQIDRQFLETLGIQSLLLIPLFKNKRTLGFLGLDTLQIHRHWSEEELRSLNRIALLISRAIQQERDLLALRQTEKMYSLLLNTIDIGVVISQHDHFLFANHAFAQMLGYREEEVHGMDYRQVFTPDGIKILLERQSKRRLGITVPPVYQTTFRCKDGSVLDVEINSVITEYNGAPATFAIVRDISVEKQQAQIRQDLEVQLLKHQRSADLTLIATTLTHNIKEILTVVIGRAQMLKTRQIGGKDVDAIINNARKIQKIFDSYLQKISYELAAEPTYFNFNDLLSIELLLLESDPFFKNQITKELRLDRTLPDYWGLCADYAHSLVAFISIFIDSLRQAPRKSLTITTQALQGSVQITIQTPNQIFSSEELAALFGPQFTLGSAPAGNIPEKKMLDKYKIYKAYLTLTQYGAQITIQAEPATGTIIKIVLPESKPPAQLDSFPASR